MELNTLQKAAAWAIVIKDFDARAKVARAEADGEMFGLNATTGAKTFTVSIGSTKIATATVAEKAGKWIITDEDAWFEFAGELDGLLDTEVVVDWRKLTEVEEALRAAGLADALIYRSTPAAGWDAGIIEVAGRPIYAATGEEVPGVMKSLGQKYTTFRAEKGMDMNALMSVFAALGESRPLGLLLEGGNE